MRWNDVRHLVTAHCYILLLSLQSRSEPRPWPGEHARQSNLTYGRCLRQLHQLPESVGQAQENETILRGRHFKPAGVSVRSPGSAGDVADETENRKGD